MKKRVLAIIMAVVTCLCSCFSNLLVLNVSASDSWGVFCYECQVWSFYPEDSAESFKVYSEIHLDSCVDPASCNDDDCPDSGKHKVEYYVHLKCKQCDEAIDYKISTKESGHHFVEGEWEGTDIHIGAYHYYDFEYYCTDCGYEVKDYKVEVPCRGNGMCVWPFSNPIIHEHVTE